MPSIVENIHQNSWDISRTAMIPWHSPIPRWWHAAMWVSSINVSPGSHEDSSLVAVAYRLTTQQGIYRVNLSWIAERLNMTKTPWKMNESLAPEMRHLPFHLKTSFEKWSQARHWKNSEISWKDFVGIGTICPNTASKNQPSEESYKHSSLGKSSHPSRWSHIADISEVIFVKCAEAFCRIQVSIIQDLWSLGDIARWVLTPTGQQKLRPRGPRRPKAFAGTPRHPNAKGIGATAMWGGSRWQCVSPRHPATDGHVVGCPFQKTKTV